MSLSGAPLAHDYPPDAGAIATLSDWLADMLEPGHRPTREQLKTQQEFIALADKELYKAKKQFHKLNK